MMYFIAEIDLTISEIEKYQGDKSFLYKKLFYLFEIKFAPVFKELQMKISIHEELSKDFDEELLIGFSYIKKFKGYFSNSDRKSTRLNSSHVRISYAVFCLKKKKKK